MSRWQAWSSHVLTVLLAGSGIVFFVMKYMVTTDDPFAVVNHPLQPVMLDLHLLAAPLLIFLFGLMFESHIQKKLQSAGRVNRRTGVIAAITFGTMSLSGYALQVSAIETLSRVALILHLASSGVFVLSYAVHQLVNFRLWRARLKAGSRNLVLEN
jgi:hypothetical protein